MKIKSFFSRILILVLLAGLTYGFLMGWEQLHLDENTVGIVFTKSSGWKDQVLSKDDFSWSFERIIPTNYTLHTFEITERTFIINKIKQLPSSNIYEDFLKLPTNTFSYSYSTTINYIFKKDFLAPFVNNGKFTQKTFMTFLEETDLLISGEIEKYLITAITSLDKLDYRYELEKHLKESFPFLDFKNIYFSIEACDPDLYNQAKEIYIDHIRTYNEAEKSFLTQQLEEQNKEKLKLELLEMYGEVFTKYPIMIEYIKTEQSLFN